MNLTSSACAILTFNRGDAVRTAWDGLLKYAPGHRTAIFEDAGYLDDTEGVLTGGAEPQVETAFTREIEARPFKDNDLEIFMGTRNLGVTGNTNRALRWFMTQTTADHLCLCNDDILVRGDFVTRYRQAHTRLGIGLLCLMPFDDSETYRPNFVMSHGLKLKICPRMTGIMMSITRECLEDVGYFDTALRTHEEHCDFTNRCRFTGHSSLDGQPLHQVDIVQDLVSYQDVPSSLGEGPVRQQQEQESAYIMQEVARNYRVEAYYRPFGTERPRLVGAHSGAGIPYHAIRDTYEVVTDRVPTFL